MTSFIFSFSFLIVATAWAENQKTTPPQPAPAATAASSECRVSEAKPLLSKAMYSGHSDYMLTTVSEKPFTIAESVNIDKDNSIKIEQRGCQDISIHFKIEMRKGAKNNLALISRATKILNDLHLDSKALLNVQQLNEIATKIKAASAKAKESKELNVCITGTPAACVAEVKVSATSTTTEFHYVAHP